MAYDQSPIDRHVGYQIESRRKALQISRADLGHMLDLSEIEIAAWEAGRTRVSASKLFEVSRVLKVPVAYFFEAYIK